MGKKINLVLFRPNVPRWKILDCHIEVIESLFWGFNALGFECTYRTNVIYPDCINIVFAWYPAIQAIQAGMMPDFPPDTILYNFEQYSAEPMQGRAMLEMVANKFQIWDYSMGNVKRWNEINPKYPAYYAKVSFAPNLMKINPLEDEDIDVLYIGGHGKKRFEQVAACGATFNRHSVIYLCSVWGKQRDDFIARAKIILNTSEGVENARIFEIVRVSYYLANKKAVICTRPTGFEQEIEDDLKDVLKFATVDTIGSLCDELVLDSEKRKKYANECFEVFRQRDVRDVIKGFFS